MLGAFLLFICMAFAYSECDVDSLQVTIHKAKVKSSDWYWWGGAKSDPNALVTVGTTSYRTDSEKNTDSPKWEETFSYSCVSADNPIFITVQDYDSWPWDSDDALFSAYWEGWASEVDTNTLVRERIYNKNKDEAKYYVDVSIYHSGLASDDDDDEGDDDNDNDEDDDDDESSNEVEEDEPSPSPFAAPSFAPSIMPTISTGELTDDTAFDGTSNESSNNAATSGSFGVNITSMNSGSGNSDEENDFMSVVTNKAIVYVFLVLALVCVAGALISSLLWPRQHANRSGAATTAAAGAESKKKGFFEGPLFRRKGISGSKEKPNIGTEAQGEGSSQQLAGQDALLVECHEY